VTHPEARAILEQADAKIVLDEDRGTANISGELTIEELQAVLQLLEYNA